MGTPWFEQPKESLHTALYDYLKSLENRQSYRDRNIVFNLGTYEDREVLGVAPGMYMRPKSVMQRGRTSINVTGALVDTAANHITQTKPLAMALTEGGDGLQQAKAKKLNKALEGAFYSLGVFEQMKRAGQDQCWAGDGIIYVDREGMKPIVERVFPGSIIIDDALSQFTAPFEMTWRTYLPREKLKRLFKKHKDAIDKAQPAKLFGISGTPGEVDLVPVYTTWRLPIDEDTPGRKVVIIQGATLSYEKYARDYFPFVFIRWRANALGFWSTGIPELVGNLQIEANKTYRNISRAVALAVPKLLLPRESGIDTDHLTNEIGSGLWYNGNAAPSWMQGQMLPPEGMGHLQFTIQQMYQLAGISELAAGMKKPAGLNSGEAQRVYHDTQADRFATPSQQYENASIEIAKRLIDVFKDIAEEFGDYSMISQTTHGFERISWSDIDLGEDDYTLKLWPVNFLSKSPADMIDQINDLIKMGMLNQKQAKKLVQFPDLEGVLRTENASEDLTQKIIEEIVENDNYMAPDPAMDPECIKTVSLARLHYKTIGLPQNKLDMLDDWVAQAALVIAPPTPPASPMGGPAMPAGLPPAAPQMAPPPMMSPV